MLKKNRIKIDKVKKSLSILCWFNIIKTAFARKNFILRTLKTKYIKNVNILIGVIC